MSIVACKGNKRVRNSVTICLKDVCMIPGIGREAQLANDCCDSSTEGSSDCKCDAEASTTNEFSDQRGDVEPLHTVGNNQQNRARFHVFSSLVLNNCRRRKALIAQLRSKREKLNSIKTQIENRLQTLCTVICADRMCNGNLTLQLRASGSDDFPVCDDTEAEKREQAFLRCKIDNEVLRENVQEKKLEYQRAKADFDAAKLDLRNFSSIQSYLDGEEQTTLLQESDSLQMELIQKLYEYKEDIFETEFKYVLPSNDQNDETGQCQQEDEQEEEDRIFLEAKPKLMREKANLLAEIEQLQSSEKVTAEVCQDIHKQIAVWKLHWIAFYVLSSALTPN